MSACEGRGHSNARTNSTDQTESNETDDTIQCIIWRECLVLVQTNDTTCKIFFIKKISDWRKLFASNQHNFHIFHQKYVSQRRFFYRNECMKQVSSKSHQKCQWLNVTKWTDKRSRIIIIIIILLLLLLYEISAQIQASSSQRHWCSTVWIMASRERIGGF